MKFPKAQRKKKFALVLIVPKPAAVKYCSGAMRLHEQKGIMRLERSAPLSWLCFNGKCGQSPRSLCLKDLWLSKAKTPVNNTGFRGPYVEPASNKWL